ncbi:single-stranded DNA-binding protein [Helicobacter trogontum]|uniref:Single-stranded DNA-binding protein n=1 Tax=Helicobacter trogontum TaxID=50960 RepID=A0A4V6HZJ1_9HELI|nr:single-stranded DNA-binding protein [Helicobacter trogontum]TLD84652.1 single-stranded DNA-binding protein [Helicobacter trogontum]
MNKVILIGNLTKDINLKYLTTGVAVGESSMAINQVYKKQDGTKVQDTCFIDIVMYGRSAEISNQCLKKGSKVCIEGKLNFQQWSDQNGNKRSKHIISVEKVEFLDTKSDDNVQQATQSTMQQTQTKANSNALAQKFEDIILKNFIIMRKNDTGLIHFKGTESEYKFAQDNWAALFELIKAKLPHTSKFDIQKDIIQTDTAQAINFDIQEEEILF